MTDVTESAHAVTSGNEGWEKPACSLCLTMLSGGVFR